MKTKFTKKIKWLQISSEPVKITRDPDNWIKMELQNVLVSKLTLIAQKLAATAGKTVNAVIIKKWSVFKCMVLTTRNCKKMDKLLQTNYVLQNWLISKTNWNMTNAMQWCKLTSNRFGPNLRTLTTLKSRNWTKMR